MEVYHITPTENVPSILRNGLTVKSGKGFSREPLSKLYVFQYPGDAYEFLDPLYDTEDVRSNYTILKIQLPRNTKLYDDPDTTDKAHDGMSTGSYIKTKHIPAKDIKVCRGKSMSSEEKEKLWDEIGFPEELKKLNRSTSAKP